MQTPYPLIAGLGGTELLIILVILVLLFGASKLPELARGSGRALRIFKTETQGLMDGDDDKNEKSAPATLKSPEELELDRRQTELDKQQADLEAERRRGDTTT